jgi:flagellar biogenesis protein FliO
VNVRGVRGWLLLLALWWATPVLAQTTRPAPVEPPKPGVHESQAIERSASPAQAKSGPAAPPAAISTGMDTVRVVLSLLLVIVVIFLLRWIAQQFFGAPSTKRSSRAVQVLSRSMIAPRQHVLVLQVGRRVLVVGDSGAQMNPLCEITDADEIAALMGQLRQDKSDPVSRAFGTFFGKAEKDYDAAPDEPPADRDREPDLDPGLATTKAELSGLIEKVRSVSKQMGQG